MSATLDEVDERSSNKQVVLEGPDNFNDWLRGINNTLLIKDLSDIADGSQPLPSAEKGKETDPAHVALRRAWRRDDRKAYGLINASVSVTVIRSVPAKLAEYDSSAEVACSFTLLEHLRRVYSSGSGPRQAELWMTVFRSDLDEGADPMPFMAKLKGAFEDIIASGTQVPDEVLSYAILGSLPPSFSIVAQTIYMQDKPPSSSVLAAVRTEWRRRETTAQRDTALLTKASRLAANSANSGNSPNSPRLASSQAHKSKPAKQSAYNPDAYCENHKFYGH